MLLIVDVDNISARRYEVCAYNSDDNGDEGEEKFIGQKLNKGIFDE